MDSLSGLSCRLEAKTRNKALPRRNPVSPQDGSLQSKSGARGLPLIGTLQQKKQPDGNAQISLKKKNWNRHPTKLQRTFFEYLMQTDSCALQWNKLNWGPAAHLEKAVI